MQNAVRRKHVSENKEGVRVHQSWFVSLGFVLLWMVVPYDGRLALAEPKVTVYEAWVRPYRRSLPWEHST